MEWDALLVIPDIVRMTQSVLVEIVEFIWKGLGCLLTLVLS